MEITTKRALAFLFLFLLTPFVSAEILLSQPQSLYNVGDAFEMTITASPNSYTSDFLIAKLVCPGKEIELFKSPYSIPGGEQREISISTNLDNFLVFGAQGECYVRAIFGEDTSESQRFEITKDITVTLDFEGIAFDPGELVKLSGKATKANSELLEGFIEVAIPGIDFAFTGATTLGDFNITFMVPENAAPGSYDITARAYEKDALEMITNEGEASGIIRINQVIKEIAVALDEQEISPVDELTYSIVLYDQAQQHAEEDVSVKVYNPEEVLFEEKIIRSGESTTLNLNSTSPPGYWKITASYNDFETTKDFLVKEYADVSFALVEDQTLIIENTGNVPYTGPVDVVIGKVNKVKEIKDLAVGAVKKFKLSAPDGNYSIEVSEGSKRQAVGTTFLTGKAISVNAVGEGFFGKSLVVLIGLVVLLVIALAVVYFYRKLHKKSAIGIGGKATPGKPGKPVLAAEKTEKTTPNVIDKGEKQDSAIVSLKIKNMEALGKSNASKAIDSALWKAKEKGAKIYSDGDFRVVIFAPVLTKEKDNTIRAIRTAQSIERVLNSYNKHSKSGIKFGIGVNSGFLIVEHDHGKFKFMSLDNIIAATKRVSESSTGEVLLSENTRRRTAGKVKSLKVKDRNLWKVERVIDRSAHAEYVRNLTAKHKKEAEHKKKHEHKK